jgi:hypothetical protein
MTIWDKILGTAGIFIIPALIIYWFLESKKEISLGLTLVIIGIFFLYFVFVIITSK